MGEIPVLAHSMSILPAPANSSHRDCRMRTLCPWCRCNYKVVNMMTECTVLAVKIRISYTKLANNL